jgi:cystathionine beta-lyase/cystathionine gamma-synthase
MFMKFATKAIHLGNDPDPSTGSIMPPIYMSSTFIQDSPGKSSSGYEYTRASNPNFSILEKQLAALEDAEYATVFSSGLGALTGLISTLSKGDKVIAVDGLYGGTYRLFNEVFNRFGIEFESLNLNTIDGIKNLGQALSKKPKWLFFETPTNPLMDIYDIEALVKIAHHCGVKTIVDNTFATPFCQNPLKWGTDIVWHSTTKYIGGHSDVIGGVVITNNPSVKKEMDFARKALGVNPSPFDTWLISRGVKTLAARMQLHLHNALHIAKFFENHAKIKKVYFPGLESHPGHFIAKKQMSGFGGIVSVEFNFPAERVKEMIASYHIFSLAESLGGVESLVCHPASMTHASIPPEERSRIGLTDALVRYSIGIEDLSDLIEDLEDGLGAV